MASSYVEVKVDKRNIANVMRQFRELQFKVQKKYLSKSMHNAVQPKLPSLANATPENKGTLKKSVGFDLSTPRKAGNASVYGIKVLGRLGYMRGNKPTGSRRPRKGYHAHWAESGVKAQKGRVTPFAIPRRTNRKYQYLKNIRTKNASHVFLMEKQKVRGQGFFSKWWRGNKASVYRALKRNIEKNLSKAISETSQKTL